MAGGHLLLLTGLETTSNLLNQSARTFSLHPELVPRLREPPALIPRFIEETLRLDSSAIVTMRTCLRDVTIALEEFVRHVGQVERTERIDWRPSLIARGPKTMPVEVLPV